MHTLSPALVTGRNGLAGVLGTMGGDVQPQVLLQLLARMLPGGQPPGEAVAAPGGPWATAASTPGTGGQDRRSTTLEFDAPTSWSEGLTARGHRVVRSPPGSNAGHAQVIMVDDDGMLAGAADPRAITGSACGW